MSTAPSLVALSRDGPGGKRPAVAVRGHRSEHALVVLPDELKAWIVSALAKGDVSARDMCTFVAAFCQTIGAPCDDSIFKAAMSAFGWTPGYGNTPADALPGNRSGFTTWKSLFVALCNAYATEPGAVPEPLWRNIRQYLQMTLVGRELEAMTMERTGSLGFVRGMKQLMRADDTPIRRLDQFLALLYKWIRDNSIEPRANREHHRLAYDTGEVLITWENGDAGDNSAFATGTSTAVALFLVLWMRGARLRDQAYWVDNVDMPMYRAIIDGLKGELAWRNVYEQATKRIKLGLNANYLPQEGDAPDNAIFQNVRLFGGNVSPTLFELALLSRQTKLILLLLEEGNANLTRHPHFQGAAHGVQVMSVLSEGALEGGTPEEQRDVLRIMGMQILHYAQSEMGEAQLTAAKDAVNALVERLKTKDLISIGDKIAIRELQKLSVALQNLQGDEWEPSDSDESDSE